MEEKIKIFIEKKRIDTEKITYIIRRDKKTCIYLADGYVTRTYFSMKNIIDNIGCESLIIINKGTAVNLKYVTDISDGKYTMEDGNVFEGRVRTPGEHKKNKKTVEILKIHESENEDNMTVSEICKKFSILDFMPIPFAVFEIEKTDVGKKDFIFRYLNSKMAEMCGCTVNSAMGRSFYSVFDNGDKKWLEINEEVALTGEPKAVHRFSPEIGKYLSVYYFSPGKNLSACAVVK